ncbi:MAG: T9SS type A sorting domain-containing protein [bacterium]
MRRIDVFAVLGVLLALVPAPESACASGVHLSFAPSSSTVAVGDTFLVDARVDPSDDDFNGFDLHIGFDSARVAFVPATPSSAQIGSLMFPSGCTNNPFHIFTAGPSQLTIAVSLMCANTFVAGPGVVYKVKFRAIADGAASFVCNAGTQFYRAGFFVNPLDCVPGVVTVAPTGVGAPAEPVEPGGLGLAPPRPNPYSGAGPATFSLDLPRSETVTVALFDASGRLFASRGQQRFDGAGRHDLTWDPGSLAPGVYFVRVATSASGETWTRWTVVR